MAYEWERYLDRNVGVPIRLIYYHYAFRDRSLAIDFLLRDTPWWGRPLYALTYPLIKRVMKKSMRIDTRSVDAAHIQLLAAFDKLDERIAHHKFLAGPLFCRADLCASALLFHNWSDQWHSPPEIKQFMKQLSDRPFFAWAHAIYRDYRSSAVR